MVIRVRFGSYFRGRQGRPLCNGDLITVVLKNVIVADDLEDVGDFDKFSCVGGVGTNTLTEATNCFGV